MKSRFRNQDPEIKIQKSRSENQDSEIKTQKSRSSFKLRVFNVLKNFISSHFFFRQQKFRIWTPCIIPANFLSELRVTKRDKLKTSKVLPLCAQKIKQANLPTGVRNICGTESTTETAIIQLPPTPSCFC